MSRMINRLRGRVYGWFDSKDAGTMAAPLPAQFRTRARLALQNLEDRAVPATFTVLNTADSGVGSLRQAVIDANAAAGPDEVVFNTVSGGGNVDFDAGFNTIALASILPAVASQNLTISGPGANLLSITATATGGFRFYAIPATQTFELRDATITGFGTTTGGAISNAAGGASNLIAQRVHFNGNTATTTGGALYLNAGQHQILNSTISSNINSGTTGGGGIRIFGAGATNSLTITNSTIAKNSAVQGGGISISSSWVGTMNINNTTITANTGSSATATTGNGVGGIGRYQTAATAVTINLNHSILAGNVAANATFPDISILSTGNLVVNATNSVLGAADTVTLTGNTNNKSGTVAAPTLAKLSTIGNYGGPTPTFIPLASSPAIDLYNPGAAATDQRGQPRPATAADAGSVERQAVEPPTFSLQTLINVTVNDATTNPYFITLDLGDVNTATLDGSDLRVTGPSGFNVLATFDSFTGNSSAATAKYKITPPVNLAAGWDGSDNGTYSVAIEANEIKSPGGAALPAGPIGSFSVGFPVTFTVLNNNDSGAGSLRQAILDANANSAKDTILFDPTFFSTPQTITMNSGAGLGQYLISGSVTITGPGASLLTLDPAFSTRQFDILGTGTLDVVISGLTLTQGKGSDGSAAPVNGVGGAIRIGDEIVLLSGMVFTDNVTSTAFDGGAVSVAAGGKLTVRNSAFSNNSASVSAGGDGGAIFSTGANLTVENSTFSGNTATGRGGAIYFNNSTAGFGLLTISNSTIHGNVTTSAAGTGGAGIALVGTVGTTSIRNSTIVANVANSTAATVGVGGGGIATISTAITLNIESSIIAGNASGNSRPDISTALAGVTVINSAIGSNAGFVLSGSSKNNLNFGSDLKLGGLQDNGGGLLTILPAADSPVLDKGTNSFSLTTDQRGLGIDTVNFPRVKNLADIGAVEAGIAQIPTATPTLTNITTSGAALYTFTVKYSDATTKITQSTIDSSDIRITGPNSFNVLATKVSTDQAGNFSPINATYSFVPPDNTVTGKWDASDNGTYTASMELDQVSNTNGAFVTAEPLGTFLVSIPTTYTVTNTSDSGAGSLRQAIFDSNASIGATDTILFDTVGAFATAQILAVGSELVISDAVIIDGSTGDGGRVTLSGGGVTRILNIAGPGTLTVNIADLNLTGATATTRGAAVLIDNENVTFTDCNFTGNTTTNNGGAIGLVGGTGAALTLVRAVVATNRAAVAGAIDTGGSPSLITITDSTINNNTGTAGGGAIVGGFPTITITGSTLAANSGTSGGGAIGFANGGTLNLSNSTLSGNIISGVGGAAINFASTATYPITANIRNSTITLNNNATTGASTSGGINWLNTNATSSITINSTIIAGNLIASTSTTASPDIRFSAAKNVLGSNNLVGVGLTSETNATFTGSNPLGTSAAKAAPLLAKLLPLSGNGGLGQTHGLAGDSPANNAGNNLAPALAKDQRGASRELPSGMPDIGAFERDPSIPTAAVSGLVNINPLNAAANDPYSFTITYTVEAGLIDFTTTDDGDEIRITGPNGFNKLATFVSATPSMMDAASIVATYKFVAPASPAGWDPTDNGTYTVSVEGSQINTVGGSKTIAAATLGSFSVSFPTISTVLNTSDSGAGSLRDAITFANGNPGPDIIVFNTDPMLGVNFSAGLNTITIGTALPSTTATADNNLTVVGPGASLLTVSPTATGYHFWTLLAGTNSVEIRNMKISGFSASTGIAAGIEVLTNTFIGDGLFITNNILSAGSGGGLALRGASHIIRNSTITNNSTGNVNGGGGAWVASAIAGSTTLFQNTTISGNTAQNGAAISFASHTGTVTIENTTITENTATSATATVGFGSGGIGRHTTTSALTVNVLNSIIANNVSLQNRFDIAFNEGSVTIGNSVVGAGDTFAFTDGGGNATGTEAAPLSPQLSALGFYGGKTPTYLPNPGSPAIDRYNPGVAGLDQRGKARPAIGADSGATERQVIEAPTYTTPTLPNVTIATLDPYTFSISFFDVNTATFDGSDFLVTGPNGFSKLATFVNFTGNATAATANYKFDAPVNSLAGFDPSDNGTYSVSLVNGQVASPGGATLDGAVVGSFRVAFPLTYIVTNTNDAGAGSLRQAVLDANLNSGINDIITFEATTFSTPQTITLTTGVMTISDGVLLTGPGKNLLTLNANGAQAFIINNGLAGNAINVTIQDVKISGGSAALGGAVSIQDENVTFLRTVLENNTSTTGGGAINVVLPAANNTLTIQDSLLQNNSATTVASGDGGAIRLAGGGGYLIVINSTLANNTAMDDGGAINLLTGNSLLVENSTLSGNAVGGAGSTSTTPDGAAVYFVGVVGSKGVNFRNATVSGNTAGPGGGNTTSVSSALGFPLVNGTVTLANSTVANNAANSTSPDAFDGGGGIAISNATGFTGSLVLVGSIVANNTSINNHPDISAQAAVNQSFSAVGSNLGFTRTAGSKFNINFGTDLKLGALAANGGIVSTHLPAADSPLLDRGSNPFTLLTDARGGGTDIANFPRTKGLTDIGAVEAGKSPKPFAYATPVAPTLNATTVNFTVDYFDTITGLDVTMLDDGDEILVTGPNAFSALASFVSIDNNTNGSPRTVTYSLPAPGGTWDDVDNGAYTYTLQANQVKSAGNVAADTEIIGSQNVLFPTLLKVSNTNDSGLGSLRQAILDANAIPGADLITFTSLFSTPQTIALSTGEMAINEAVTITGAGMGNVTVDMGGVGRHFNTAGAPTGAAITITDMTLSGGSAATGGAIDISDEAVTLERMALLNNVGPTGGAIRVALAGASLTVRDSNISNNSSSTAGGGIAVLTTSPLLIERSTFVGNVVTTGNSGGAIRYVGNPGPSGFIVRNSTFFGNTSGFNGGAIGFSNLGAGAFALIESCTIVGNTANGTGSGGGIATNTTATAGTIEILNSIVTNNFALGTGGQDISVPNAGVLVNVNTSAYTDTVGFSPTGAGNIIGQDMKLAALASNGGFTQTMLPASDSPAVNSGSPTSSLTTDQRGLTRLVGSKVDMGAVELQSTAPVVTGFIVNGNPSAATQRSRLTQVVVNFATAVDAAQFQVPGAVFFTRTGVASNNVEPVGTVVNNTNGLIISPATGSVTSITLTFANIDNTGVDFGSLSDGRWQLSVVPAAFVSVNGPTDIQLRRLFGDTDNSGNVDGTDFGTFPPFGATVANPFDFNNDLNIDGGDFGEFGGRFGYTLA